MRRDSRTPGISVDCSSATSPYPRKRSVDFTPVRMSTQNEADPVVGIVSFFCLSILLFGDSEVAIIPLLHQTRRSLLVCPPSPM